MFRVTLTLAMAFALSGCTALPSLQTANYERVVAQFEATVTSAEFVHRGPTAVVRKWRGPVRYAVLNADPFQAAIIQHNMETLQGLTGIRIIQVDPSQNANFRIVFGDRKRLHNWLTRTMGGDTPQVRTIANSPCFANLGYDDAGVIEYVQVGINTGNQGHLMRHCMLEELVQAFGPVDDACHFRPSLFCDGPGTHDTGLTPGDEIIMKALYDRRIQPGMTREQAMPVAREVIAKLMAEYSS